MNPAGPLHLSVPEAYDRWARLYDSYDNPMVAAAARVLALLTHPGATVYEFGCGTGRNLAALLAMGATRAVGCDLSPGMLSQARQREVRLELFQQDMAQPAPLPDASTDLALFSLSLEHIANLEPAFREARRLLKPEGRVLILEIHPFLSLSGVAAHFKEENDEIHMPTYPHQFSGYFAACNAAGFAIDRCREWRPCDFQPPLTAKTFKRGAETPLLVEFQLSLAR